MDDDGDYMSPDESLLHSHSANFTAAGYGSPIEDPNEDYEDDDEEEEEERMKRQRSSSLASTMFVPRNSVCERATQNTIQSQTSVELMRNGRKPRAERQFDTPDTFARALSERLTGPWLQHTFKRRECIRYVPVEGCVDRCGCGRSMALHCQLALSRFVVHRGSSDGSSSTPRGPERWSILTHTRTYPTDAFGTISFQGGAHSHKANYLRLAYDSAPEDIMYVFEKIWGLQPPRLIISVHGGMSNFEIQEKLGKQFREGLFKAAKTTGAWIITSGVDSGVVKHVAMALDEAGITARMRSKIVTIGIAPWGALRRKERLVGMGINVNYDAHSFSKRQGLSCLNGHHSYFLLADNGTTGRHGADLKLRTRFEEYLASLKMAHGTRGIPIVCAVLEGGTHTINSVHKYLTNEPRVPVIVCDGSGRASDIISFAARYVDSEGFFPDEIRAQILSLISSVFPASPRSAEQVLDQIAECATQIDLLTIFRYGEEQQREDVDHAILTAILRRQNIALPDKLSFCLAWNRVDVARACFDTSSEHLQAVDLYPAMVEALRLERVDFLECFMEHGVSMKKFLTFARLEHLYNLDDKTSHSIRYLSTNAIIKRKITIPMIGAIVEKLMGGNYRSYYTSRNFRNKYNKSKEKMQKSASGNSLNGNAKKAISSKSKAPAVYEGEDSNVFDFPQPFNELMIWSILTRRPEMARLMWLHGEDSMAKSLCAIRLYKSIANLAEREYVEVDTATMLRQHAKTFTDDSIALLDCCYQADDESTLRLLTAELADWGNHTCLSLAVLANNKKFLAHECCQMLLAEQWHGSLRKKSNSNLRVVAAILLPLTALFLSYKNVEETVKPRVRDSPVRSRHHSSESSSDESDVTQYSSNNPYRSRQSAQSKASLMNRVVKFISNPFARWTDNTRDGSISLISGMEGNFKKKKRVNFDSTSNISSTTYSAMVHPQVQMSKLARIRAFYSAPICKFWTWCISFHIWLIASIYTLLIETPTKTTNLELLLLVYITVYGAEYLRKFFICDQPTMRDKFNVFFRKYWNILTILAVVTYLVGFAVRCNPITKAHGRVILCCSNVLWHVKVLDYLSIHPKLGPYITMAGKMVHAMMLMIIILVVPTCAFGVVRQSITFPKHKDFEWILVRNIFYKPYFMLYGEVYAGEIDTCNDEDVNCQVGGFIPPILMTIFLLVANILIINMLIAIFNNIFNTINAQAQEVWLFQQYSQLLEYNETPTLPPPFTFVTHLTQLGILILQRCCRTCKTRSIRGNRRVGILDVSMKLYLSEEEMRMLNDFEEDCIDELTRKRAETFDMSGEERWSAAVRQTDVMSQRVSDLVQENFSLRNRIWDMESRLSDLVKGQQILYERMRSKRSAEEPRAIQPSLSDSTQSLPEKIEQSKDCLRRHYTEYTSITDNIRLIPCALMSKQQPRASLLKTLQTDATLRKYDEAGLRPITRRRMNSSSVSIAQDMKEMEKESAKTKEKRHSVDDICLADIVIEGREWEPPTKEQVAAITAHLSSASSSAPPYEPMANASSTSSSPLITHRPSPNPLLHSPSSPSFFLKPPQQQ